MMKTMRALALAALALPGCEGNIDDGNTLLAVTQRVSLGTGDAEGNAGSFNPSLSADGRYVVFDSDAGNLVPGDTNNARDVFVRDLLTGTTILVSVAHDGSPADGASSLGAISADGRYVAFQSWATNLTATPDANGSEDIYLRDLAAGTTVLISATPGGAPAGFSTNAAISPDGGYVAFQSTTPAETLVSGLGFTDDNSVNDVFLRRVGGPMYLASAGTSNNTSLNVIGNGASSQPRLSEVGSSGPSGLFVTFESQAGNLIAAGSASPHVHVYRRAMPTPTLAGTARVSVTPGGAPGNAQSISASISPDGRYVAFNSSASDLVPGDANQQQDIFLRDMDLSATVLVSTHTSGAQGAAPSTEPSVSRNGLYVAFLSMAPNLVDGDTNLAPDGFLRDVRAGTTVRISVRTYGGQTPTALGSQRPAISADGRYAAFSSNAGTLVDGDRNGFEDVFVRGPFH